MAVPDLVLLSSGHARLRERLLLLDDLVARVPDLGLLLIDPHKKRPALSLQRLQLLALHKYARLRVGAVD